MKTMKKNLLILGAIFEFRYTQRDGVLCCIEISVSYLLFGVSVYGRGILYFIRTTSHSFLLFPYGYASATGGFGVRFKLSFPSLSCSWFDLRRTRMGKSRYHKNCT